MATTYPTLPQRIARSAGAFLTRIMPGATADQKARRFSEAVETFKAGNFANDADMLAKLKAANAALEEYLKVLENER